ncbi:MAG: coenzyme F420-0:L-glutamate ligase [Candidatus Bathyarchaeia archaeon]
MKPKAFTVLGLVGFPLIKAGDDLAEIIVETAKKNGVVFDDYDIVVVAQKIVSKADGHVVCLRDVKPSEKAQELAKATGRDARLLELVLKETNHVIKATLETVIVEDKRGLICINAGIDKSNVEDHDCYTLLPPNPNSSAEHLRTQLMRLTGKKLAVIICDTYSRPFRRGQTEFAIGVAGIRPFVDYRGCEDLFGYILKVKKSAIADEIACAAELIMGQGKEGIPVAIIKGLRQLNRVEFSDDEVSIDELLIRREEDLFKDTL